MTSKVITCNFEVNKTILTHLKLRKEVSVTDGSTLIIEKLRFKKKRNSRVKNKTT